MRFLLGQGKALTRLRELLRRPDKRVILALLCGVCLVLLLASEWSGGERPKAQTQTAVDPAAYAETLETRLATLIRHIRGAGETRVFVTLRADGETVWARNDQLEREEGELARLRSSQEYVLLRDGSGESGLRLRTSMPTVQGVAVVCAGADDPAVCQRITQTVTAALGIGASHVSVVQMQ